MPQAAQYPKQRIQQNNTVRLISTAYTGTRETVLHTLGLPEEQIADLAELNGVTNERMEAELGRRNGISIHELVFGFPEAHIINASFTHPKDGGRFHDRWRGAWYAGCDEETAIAEVRYHRLRALEYTAAAGTFQFPYQAFLADFAGEFHQVTAQDRELLQAEPVPQCYERPQALARAWLDQGSAGVLYPSVRHLGGSVIACFRPALVFHVRRGNQVKVEVTAE